MGVGQHRLVGIAVREAADGLDDLVHHRQQTAGSRIEEHEPVGEVVDVLGGAGEVDELLHRGQLRHLPDLFLEEVLDGLHVVVGRAFDLLDPRGALEIEAVDDVVEVEIRFLSERRDLGDLRMRGERLEPTHLDQHAVADQPVLAEYGA